ncbi:MAG: malonyl-CoA synthase [Pseudomonadota bacterium]
MSDGNHLIDALGASTASNRDALFAETRNGERITYGDLFAQASTFAAALSANGVVPGDRVAVQVEKSLEAISLYLGVVMAGGVFLTLNTAYTPAEIEYFLTDAEPRIFVCDPAKAAALRPFSEGAGVSRLLTMDADGAGSLKDDAGRADFVPVPRSADDLAAILYTSGTTGRSKGAMLSHENLASNSRALCDLWRFTSEDRLIHALPIFHTHGLFVATNVTLLAGGSLLFLPKFDADAIIEMMPKATAMMGVPTFYTRLLNEPTLAQASSDMRLFVSGSAPLLAETHDQWRDITGHAILERYGMTETNMNTSNPYEGDRRAGTVGMPLPGVEVKVTEPSDGADLPVGEIGMVEVRGPNVFKGYWRMPEKTAEELRSDGFFITGDLGQFDERGYLSIVGRGKDLIISGGFNVYPKEVEAEIDDLPGVEESAVISAPHPDFGEGVIAVVVAEGVTEDGIIAALSDRLAKFKQPKRIFFVDELPRNTMGKVQKNVMRETYKEAFS